MADEGEFSGKTVEDAIVQAESQLGASRDELEIQIISQGSRGVFGIGAESAKVRVRHRDVAPAEPVAAESVLAPQSHDAVALAVDEHPHEHEGLIVVESPNGTADLLTEASEVLRQLLKTMGFDAAVSVRSEQDPIMLGITGENLGVLIGRRGDNLAALQFMVNLILSKNRRQWPRIVIDVENYRERREQSLQTLAERIAYRVQRNGRPFTLEAMPAGDRRVIHLSQRERSDIETYSIGEGAARRVVIAPKRVSQGSYSRY